MTTCSNHSTFSAAKHGRSWHRMQGAFKRPESHSLLRNVLTSDA